MNWMKKNTLAYTVGLLLAVGAVGLLTGCGDMATGPNSGTDDLVVVHNIGKGNDGTTINGGTTQAGLIGELLNGVVGLVNKSASRVVGILGGTVEVPLLAGPSKLVIPAGAVNSPQSITMNVVQAKVGNCYFTEYEFGPHGLVFNKPTQLTISLPYANGTMVTLRWLNPQTGQWEVQATRAVGAGKVQFQVYHFSKYGIS